MQKNNFTLIVFLSCLLSACSANQNISTDFATAYKIQEQVESNHLIIRDQALQSYLSKLSFRLISNSSVRILIARDEAPYAKSYPAGLVLVSSSLLKTCRSESELAFVLAHELGHLMLGHHLDQISSLGDGELRKRELSADAFALQAITNAGYSVTGALSSIQRLNNIWNFYDVHTGQDYPSASERLSYLQSQFLNQACLESARCSLEGTVNSRDFNKFIQRLLVLSKEN